uniref:NTF2 domain-containing protein n=1 Tax=Panagrolaimus superbus TaxID=310955 RepID=A0A914Z1Y1_9BILA
MSQDRQRQRELLNVIKDFYNRYQTALDTHRSTIDKFYHNDGHILFDGKMYKSPYSAKMFWVNLPTSVHSIRTFNHNMYTMSPTKTIFIICATGSVTFGEKVHTYSQSLTCNYENDNMMIYSDDYRLMN